MRGPGLSEVVREAEVIVLCVKLRAQSKDGKIEANWNWPHPGEGSGWWFPVSRMRAGASLPVLAVMPITRGRCTPSPKVPGKKPSPGGWSRKSPGVPKSSLAWSLLGISGGGRGVLAEGSLPICWGGFPFLQDQSPGFEVKPRGQPSIGGWGGGGEDGGELSEGCRVPASWAACTSLSSCVISASARHWCVSTLVPRA